MTFLRNEVTIEPASDLTAAKAIDTTSINANATLQTGGLGGYIYDPSSTATPDDNNVIEPTTGGGRFLRQAPRLVDVVDGTNLIRTTSLNLPYIEVGPDGKYATLKEAVEAGEQYIVVTANTTEIADISVTNQTTAIDILQGVTVDMGDFSFVITNSGSPAQTISIEGRGTVRYAHTVADTQLFQNATTATDKIIIFRNCRIVNESTAANCHLADEMNIYWVLVTFFAPNFDNCGVFIDPTDTTHRVYIQSARFIGAGSACSNVINVQGGLFTNIDMTGQFSASVTAINIAGDAILSNLGLNHTTNQMVVTIEGKINGISNANSTQGVLLSTAGTGGVTAEISNVTLINTSSFTASNAADTLNASNIDIDGNFIIQGDNIQSFLILNVQSLQALAQTIFM